MIETSLYNHLMDQEQILGPLLATYDRKPAIFNQEAPDDQDELWETSTQYGRIVFFVEMSKDPERKASGTLLIDIMCQKGSPSPPPEEIEPIIREMIDGYFFPTENQGAMAVQWKNSQAFSEPKKQIAGVTMMFSILAFPIQSSFTDPEPIGLLNSWTKEVYCESYVIGHDSQPERAWKPTDHSPAIYWRIVHIGNCSWIPDTYGASWLDAQFRCHIMAPSYDVAIDIARDMQHRFVLAKRLVFDDGSPLMIDRRVYIQPGADALRAGQLTVDGTFGILTYIPEKAPIQNIVLKDKEVF